MELYSTSLPKTIKRSMNFSQDVKWLFFLLRRILGVWVRTTIVRVRLRAVKPVKPAKKYIITLTDVPASVEAARRCIESAKRHGEDDNLEIFPGVDRHKSREFFFEHGLTRAHWQERLNDPLALSGCFASHYKLWLRCIELGQPIMILEHDAEFLAPVPPLRFRYHISLAANDGFMTRIARCVFRLLGNPEGREIYSPFGMAPGNCCYMIKPEGARRLVEAAHRKPIVSTDNLITPDVIELLCYYPFPVRPDKRFSLIGVKEFSLIGVSRNKLH